MTSVCEVNDNETGKVEEFYFEYSTWDIRYITVKTGSLLFGRKVFIAPQAVQKVDRKKNNFTVKFTKNKQKKSPENRY